MTDLTHLSYHRYDESHYDVSDEKDIIYYIPEKVKEIEYFPRRRQKETIDQLFKGIEDV